MLYRGRGWRLHSALLVGVAAGALVGLYVLRLVFIGHAEVLRSDYLMLDTAAHLIRTGLGHQLYVDQVQGPVYTALASGDHTGDLLYNHAPISAVLVVPFSLLSAGTGHIAWSLLQLVLLAAACLLVARAAPWPVGVRRTVIVATVLAALAGGGTLPLLLQGQTVGELALGLGAAYWLWRRGWRPWAGAVLALAAAADTPHLALGLLAFLIGWRERRVILGALAGLGAAFVLSVAAVGLQGVAGFVVDVMRSLTLYSPSVQEGLTGFFTSLAGHTPCAVALSVLGILLALAGCLRLGAAVRRPPERLEFLLLAATGLSLVAAPHLLIHDLALLAPPFVAAVAAALADAAIASSTHRIVRLSELWVVLMIAAGLDSTLQPMIKLTPIALLLLAWYGWRFSTEPRARQVTLERAATLVRMQAPR